MKKRYSNRSQKRIKWELKGKLKSSKKGVYQELRRNWKGIEEEQNKT